MPYNARRLPREFALRLRPRLPHPYLLVRRIRDDIHVVMTGCHGPYLSYTPTASRSSVLNSVVYNPFSGEKLRLARMVFTLMARQKVLGHLSRAQLSSTPASCTATTTPTCLVAAVPSKFRSSVCICRLGVHGDDQEKYWVASRVFGKDISIHDLVFHKGILHCICKNITGHCIMAIDLHHLLLHDIHDDDDVDLFMPIWLPAPRLVTVLGDKKHPSDRSRQYLPLGCGIIDRYWGSITGRHPTRWLFKIIIS